MNHSTANRLILVLAALVMMTLLILVALRLGQKPPTNEQGIILPTSVIQATLPIPPPLPISTIPGTPFPTDTPVVNPVTSTPIPLPTVTIVSNTSLTHIVQDGENLTTIAEQYQVSVEAIVEANDLNNADEITVGQTLIIPIGATPQPASQPLQSFVVVPVSPSLILTPPTWPPSRTGDEGINDYPLTHNTPSGHVTIHYQPGTYPDSQIDNMSQTIETIWADIQQQLGKSFPRTINVYLAGTLFAINPALQGLTQSWQDRSFILVNGTFHTGEEQYIIAHELTHIAATHLLGAASSTMIHEGIAVHLPQNYLTQQAGYLPHTEICAALLGTPEFKTATQMQAFSYGPTGFGGHIRSFFHYNLSGCFVAYLLETYGLEKFDSVYGSGNYVGVYGRSLSELDQEWQNWLLTIPVKVDAQELIQVVNNVTVAYQVYTTASTGGIHAHWEAYLHLNRARLATNQGQFTQATTELNLFYTLFALQ